MDTKILQNKQSLLFLILGVTSYIIFILLARYCKPLTLANLLGCLAFIAYITTLSPSMFRAIFPNMRGNKILILLLKRRRDIGIVSYILASNHALIMAVEKNINFLDKNTYIHYFQGILMLFIMSLLAITSNDWSVKLLQRNWIKLHKTSYSILFIIPWHILDKMSHKWSYITPLELLITLIFVCFFVKRKVWKDKLL